MKMSSISQGKLILLSCQIRGFVLGGYKIIQTCYLCPCWTLNFILIFTLFNRLPQRLGFPACLFLLNLFSFPNSLPPYPSFVSVPFSSSCFTFSFQPFPSLWSWRSVWLVFTATLYGSLLLFVAGSTTGRFYIFWSNNREICVLDIQSNYVQVKSISSLLKGNQNLLARAQTQ